MRLVWKNCPFAISVFIFFANRWNPITPRLPLPMGERYIIDKAEKETADDGHIPWESLESGSLQNWILEMESKYKKINGRIKSVCHDYDGKIDNLKEVHNRILKSFLHLPFSKKYHIGVCRQPKVGSTTWMLHLSRLSEHPVQLRKLILEMAGSETAKLFRSEFSLKDDDATNIRNYFTRSGNVTSTIAKFIEKNNILLFSFVRHPFERLVSCYKDKVEGNPFHKKSGLIPESKGLNFPEFIDHVIKTLKTKGCDKTPIKIPFCRVNIHWRPQISRCHYCHAPFKVIGKAETFQEDVAYILIKQNLTHLIPLEEASLVFRETIQNQMSRTELPTKRALYYFKTISKDQIMELYESYKLDFNLFDYNHLPYLKVGKP